MNLLALLQQYLSQIISWLQGQAVTQLKKPDPVLPPVVITSSPNQPSFKLTRKEFRADGIFSEMADKDGNIVAHTLEHSYNNLPKIPNGVWKCIRGPHRLHGMAEDFITFEITGIEGHTDLLFHWGNYNKDSEGCILMGEAEIQVNTVDMITNSKVTWQKWMDSLVGINEFELTVC